MASGPTTIAHLRDAHGLTFDYVIDRVSPKAKHDAAHADEGTPTHDTREPHRKEQGR